MRKICFCLLCLSALVCSAQKNLSGSPKASTYTYVYKINAKEAGQFYATNFKKKQEKFLHSLVDSFTREQPHLPAGNYLLVHAVENTLVYKLHTVGDVAYKLINNNRDFTVAVHTKEGRLINGASVYINKKKLAFDAATQVYRKEKYKKGGHLTIINQDVLHRFPIAKSYTQPSTFWRKLAQTFPVKQLITPIRKIFKKSSFWQQQNFFYATPNENKFKGFVVTSKPMYKPGDTVKIKAFVTDKRGNPLNEKLLVRLSNRELDVDTILATISPYSKGNYTYSFVLTDSLKMDLDEEYLLALEKEKSKKFNYATYDGDLDEQEYAIKRLIVTRGLFHYEEYELASISFTARSDKKETSRGTTASVYVKASDENGLAVMDGRVQVIVRPLPYNAKTFEAPTVFLPDTLWVHEQALETLGETKITLPDAIFPKANFSYEVECILLTTNNERQRQSLYQSFSNENQEISFHQKNDSLQINYLLQGKSSPLRVELLSLLDKGDTLERQMVQLPVTITINPFVKAYAISTNSIKNRHEVANLKASLSVATSRTKDSVYIELVNPQGLKVWYTLFNSNKVLLRGFGDSLQYLASTRNAKNYFASIQYIYNGRAYTQEYTIPYQEKLLSVTLSQPTIVYPGQTTQVVVAVKNGQGEPVAGADVTTWAYTEKFKDIPPLNIPYLGKVYPNRKRYANFSSANPIAFSHAVKLSWKRWSREMRLDTIEYYKFLHPETFYINTEPAKDTITQVAPFIVADGDVVPIHHIYIDEVPVYFSAAEQVQRYSFAVTPGKHSFRFRTIDKLVYLDSFYIPKGVKTFLSINADTSNKNIIIKKMPDTLTTYEKNLWGKYILVVENNFGEQYASIQNNRIFYLVNQHSGNPSFLVGPLTNQYAQLAVKNKFTQKFEAEGGYKYTITPGLIKQKEIRYPYFANQLRTHPKQDNFQDKVLTEKEIDSLWQEYLYYRSAAEDLFTNPHFNTKGNGQLQIGITKDTGEKEMFVRNIFLFKYDDPDFLRIYKGSSRNLGYVQPGKYRLLFLLRDDAYFIKDSVYIKKDGINYYETGTITPKEKDSISLRLSTIMHNRELNARWYDTGDDVQKIKETFNQKYFDVSLLTQTIYGTVRDSKGKPVAFATVRVKGVGIFATSDAEGRFSLRAAPNSTLVVSYVGYMAQELKVAQNNDLSFTLLTSKQSLEEVVVVGYGSARKRDITGAVASITSDSLVGRVSGISIRGTGTVSSSPLLLIVDGLPYAGSIEDLDPAVIASMKVMNKATGTALYGSIAINGVIIITTKKAGEKGQVPEASATGFNSIRRNFRDDAWWQPNLKTNEEGKASFTVTYPDDITAWKTMTVATTGKKQTGYTEAIVRSFKAISANLAFPLFAIEGDSLFTIGKALNYGTDTIQAKRSFYINQQLVKEAMLSFHSSWIDSFLVVTPVADSLTLKYTIQKNDGYFDGEERSIPVHKQGVLESSGMFAALRGDTSFILQPSADTSAVKIYAEASVLPSIEKEIEGIRSYQYLCNEQIASKLKALLAQKRIDHYLKRNFKGDKNIRELVGLLSQNKAVSGLWGWWAGNEPAAWISLHVLEALLQAQSAGYATALNKPMLIDYLVYNMESYGGTEKLLAVHLLHLLGAKVDYKKYTDSLQNDLPKMSLYQKLRLAEIKQKAGLDFSIDSLVAKQSRTMFGNLHWGEEGYRFFDNAVQNTLVMYRLLRTSGNHKITLEKMRGYFLERRKTGYWRNTYESSLIIETILPDLLVNDSLQKPAVLTLTTTDVQTIKSFPFSTLVKGGHPITVSKQGALPIYFSTYQQHWNTTPKKIEGDFVVKTIFIKNGDEQAQLKGGEPVQLKVAVTVKADAQYVMIEVPIPAGCSYASRAQGYANNEIHREHFKNKVSIFCNSLQKGDYVFTISLLPRYSGKYLLNPAHAALMYFPVFYGREEMKKVVIK